MEYEHIVLILGAVIAAGAAIIGSLITALSSKGTNKAQMQQTVLQEFLIRRLAAYDDVLRCDLDFWTSSFSEASHNAFVASIHRACLVASDDTLLKLLSYSDSVSDLHSDTHKYKTARIDAVKAMRADLWSYDTPQIKKK